MKLEVGMYVRYKRGSMGYNIEPADKIGKIINRVNESDIYELDNNNNNIFENDVVKASFNIIDILEVGDYVNGHEVEEVNNNLNEHKGTCNSLDTYLWVVNDLDEFEEIVIFEKDIKSIVTKKQFESMEYRIGDE